MTDSCVIGLEYDQHVHILKVCEYAVCVKNQVNFLPMRLIQTSQTSKKK